MCSLPMSNAVDAIYANRNRFIVIGLTGRTGAGCSEVAKILASDVKSVVGKNVTILDYMDNESRKSNIIKTFTRKNWQKFCIIKVRDIISMFLLEKEYEDAVEYMKKILPAVADLQLKELFEKTKKEFACLDEVLSDNHNKADPVKVYKFVSSTINKFTDEIKKKLDDQSKDRCIKAYQAIGDNIRLYGNAFGDGSVSGDNIYAISIRINLILKALRHYNKQKSIYDYFVIDAFRNPIEVKFFQERYAGFYLWAINAPEEHRRDRLLNDKIMDIEKIQNIDNKEFSKGKILKEQNSFISQNIRDCIQAADVLIRNIGDHNNNDFSQLKEQVIKYVSLIKRPGVITPSRDERCMQVACVAKLNSGCISRQVGAAVADAQGYIRSIGWNDAPAGQTPCIMKNLTDLLDNTDRQSYSNYEHSDEEFIAKAKEKLTTLRTETAKRGLNTSYCFKDIQNSIDEDDNQVHTRALHAEENAFLALISGYTGSIKLDTLYTTSSTCVLCAKKAYQLGIRKIVYVSPYPDIAFEHIIKNGTSRPELELYSGALGSAFHRLYLPVVSFKDELQALTVATKER